MKSVAVVGASLAGLSAARALREDLARGGRPVGDCAARYDPAVGAHRRVEHRTGARERPAVLGVNRTRPFMRWRRQLATEASQKARSL